MATTTVQLPYYPGRQTRLGDHLCVIEAWSDWGEKGLMVCEEMRDPERGTRRYPKVFFPAGELDAAIECAKTIRFD